MASPAIKSILCGCIVLVFGIIDINRNSAMARSTTDADKSVALLQQHLCRDECSKKFAMDDMSCLQQPECSMMPTNATTGNGIPFPSYTKSLTVPDSTPGCAKCQGGYVLLQDTLAAFDRERIPERVVHAKGAGAFGYFEVTDDITKYTRAKLFESLGKRTRIAIRFSQVARESGHADTYRDPRGFAMKFYTEEGNWDLVGNNTPIFFIRDPILFPSFVHSQKRNPVNNLPDADTYWDFVTQRPETTHQICYLFSDRGIPNGFRFMHAFGSHTFKFVNADFKVVYVKFHMRTDQGVQNMSPQLARELAGTDPDYLTRDLYSAIRSKNYPSWTFCIQVMTFEQAKTFRWDPFDLTKVWPYEDFPLIRVGKFVLNENPTNYFAQIEQLAFAPSHMVPGIEASPDKMLQARLFSYADTQRYRLGVNWLQLPVNRAKVVNTYDYGGFMRYDIPSEGPNYFPNTFDGYKENPRGKQSVFRVSGDVDRYDTSGEDNFSQVTIFWNKCLTSEARQRLVDNLADNITNAIDRIQDACVSLFSNIHRDFGRMLRIALDERRTKKI